MKGLCQVVYFHEFGVVHMASHIGQDLIRFVDIHGRCRLPFGLITFYDVSCNDA